MSHHYRVNHRKLIKFVVVLLQYRQTLAVTKLYVAACRIEVAAQHADECGFAGTIGTDYTVAVPCCEFEIDIRKQNTLAKLNG